MSAEFQRFCVIIPCFNHASTLEGVIKRVRPFISDCIVVDDGSRDEEAKEIQAVAERFDGVSAIRLPQNGGKGAAVSAGLREAKKRGFTHAAQVDADGQHAIEKLPELIALAQRNPKSCICGEPVYDESVPKGRLIGRKITDFWVAVETLSLKLKDSMCGFRIYPVESTLEIINQGRIGMRMDFDIEILVRLYWENVPLIYVPVEVKYPPGGTSNFDVLRDNIRISKMHSKLFFESFRHLAGNVKRAVGPSLNSSSAAAAAVASDANAPRLTSEATASRVSRLTSEATASRSSRVTVEATGSGSPRWEQLEERKGVWGIRFLLAAYKLGGRNAFRVFVSPVMTAFWLFGAKQRRASRDFQQRVFAFANQEMENKPGNKPKYKPRNKPHGSLAHFFSFADALLDKIIVWSGELKFGRDVRYADATSQALFEQANADSRGKLLFVSHLGSAEAMRAIGEHEFGAEVYVLIFDKNAKQFKKMMGTQAPESQLHLIEVDEIDIATAAELKEKADRGAWIAIAADRVPLNLTDPSDKRVIRESFLGKEALFPIGPYVLASILGCPVYSMFAVREGEELLIRGEKLADRMILPRKERKKALHRYARRYIDQLEKTAVAYPLQWFNFFDFWDVKDDSAP